MSSISSTPKAAQSDGTRSAQTLRPAHDSLLHIIQGSAWVTLPSQRGDHVLHAGQQLAVCSHEPVVIEDWHAEGSEALRYALEPSAQHSNAGGTAWHSLRTVSPSYCQAVLAPWADLLAALGLGASALRRLVRGVSAWLLGKLLDVATFLIAGSARSTWT